MKHYLCFVSYVFSIHILVSLVCNGGLGVGREKMAEKIEKERQPSPKYHVDAKLLCLALQPPTCSFAHMI